MKSSKYEPSVDQVELLEANPKYAHIRHQDGRESTVALRHLAPIGNADSELTPLNPIASEPTCPPESEMPDSSDIVVPDSSEQNICTAEDMPDSSEVESTEPASSERKSDAKQPTFIRTRAYHLRSGHK